MWLLWFIILFSSPRVHTNDAPTLAQLCTPIASGKATYYGIGDGFAGRPTASGETYVIEKLTAAHRTLPLGSQVLVSAGNHHVVVRINDRGPARWTNNLIDLSPTAFARLARLSDGVVNVRLSLCAG